MNMSQPTLKDVALRAGVSAMTASEVARSSDRVAPETRARVLEAMQALGYEPNQTARAMRLSKSFTIAYVAANPHDFADPAMGLNLAALLEHFDATGYNLNIQTLSDHGEQALRGLQRSLRQKRIDGAIIAALPGGALLEELIGWNHPIVLYDQPQTQTNTVWAEYRDGIVQAVKHLAARGRRQIAFIGGPNEQAMPYYLNSERHAGFLEGMKTVGLEIDPKLVLNSDYSIEGGRQAALKLLEGKRRPDAIVAASDRMAFGALQAASTLGLRVPGDIAVTGFNDHELALFSNPPLTTIRFPIREMALKAAELLFTQINQTAQGQPLRAAIPVELVARDSS